MKVIKHGNTCDTQVCPKCQCEFVFTKKDKIEADILGTTLFYVICPECGRDIDLWKIEKGELEYLDYKPSKEV